MFTELNWQWSWCYQAKFAGVTSDSADLVFVNYMPHPRQLLVNSIICAAAVMRSMTLYPL